MPWRLINCLLKRHRVDPGVVLWNGTHHLSRCRDCKRPLRRSSRGYWKQMEGSADEADG
jgi:hypothetical protein